MGEFYYSTASLCEHSLGKTNITEEKNLQEKLSLSTLAVNILLNPLKVESL